MTLRIFPAFPFTCLPIVKANPAVGRNCFQMTLWERKTHFIKKLQNKKQSMYALWARVSYGLFPGIVQSASSRGNNNRANVPCARVRRPGLGRDLAGLGENHLTSLATIFFPLKNCIPPSLGIPVKASENASRRRTM